MNVGEAKTHREHADTKKMVAAKLDALIENIEHIGYVPWEARHGYIKLCDCQRSILFAVEVLLRYEMTIRDGDGFDTFVLQGKCIACEKIYVAETHR